MPKEENKSSDPTGLGLTDFISGVKKEENTSSSTTTKDETIIKAEIKSDTKIEDDKTGILVDKTKSEEGKHHSLESQKIISDEKKEEKKIDEKIENKPSINWDEDENPYKKRYYDTAKWANNINQELRIIQKDVTIANKKLDGTYDPETEAKAAEIDPQLLTREAEVRGKVSASMAMAEDKYGKDYVQKTIFSDNAPFRQFDNDPYVQGRVLSSNAPVMEAIKILKEREFFSKYGHEPEQIINAIKIETEKEITDRITKQVTEQIMKRLDEKERQITGVGDARGSENKTEVKATGFKKLSELFPG